MQPDEGIEETLLPFAANVKSALSHSRNRLEERPDQCGQGVPTSFRLQRRDEKSQPTL